MLLACYVYAIEHTRIRPAARMHAMSQGHVSWKRPYGIYFV
jgi:hypothetical protein